MTRDESQAGPPEQPEDPTPDIRAAEYVLGTLGPAEREEAQAMLAFDPVFAALVRDSLGRISAGADREVCTTTVRPPFFYGCSVVQGGTPTGSGAAASAPALALVVAAWMLRSPRERRPRG